MEKLITIIFSIIVLCSCINSAQTEAENDSLSSMTDCSIATECYKSLTKNQLETILEDIKPYADTPLRYTYVNNVDNENVLTDFTTLSDSTEYHYFIKRYNETKSIDKIIGKTSVYGIKRNFVVVHIDENLNSKYREIGDNILSEINKNYESIQTGAFDDLPMQVHIGKIEQVNFLTVYDNEDEVLNLSPQYIIECNDKKTVLKNGTVFLMGYDYKNLEQKTYAVLKDSSDNYTYYYDMDKLCSSIN